MDAHVLQAIPEATAEETLLNQQLTREEAHAGEGNAESFREVRPLLRPALEVEVIGVGPRTSVSLILFSQHQAVPRRQDPAERLSRLLAHKEAAAKLQKTHC